VRGGGAAAAAADSGADGARERLLRGAQQLLFDRGRLSDLSLRAMAELLGTSHRMLIYHFGSRDGLLAALLVELGRQERAMLLDQDRCGGVLDALRLLESAYLDRTRAPRSTAFFYVLGLAAQDPDTYREFLESVDAWVELFTLLGEREGRPHEVASACAHALVWAARGAMFQGLADGRREEALRVFRGVVAQLGYPAEQLDQPCQLEQLDHRLSPR
jgi:AcrR family transcriptional regulator